MAIKTYLPTLARIVHAVCYYTAKYDTQIRKSLPENVVPIYNTLRSTCAAFTEAFGQIPKNP